MIVVDVNLLIYAVNEDSPDHKKAKALKGLADGCPPRFHFTHLFTRATWRFCAAASIWRLCRFNSRSLTEAESEGQCAPSQWDFSLNPGGVFRLVRRILGSISADS